MHHPYELIEPKELESSNSLALAQDPTQILASSWKICVNRSSNSKGSRAGIVITSPKGIISEHALCLEFLATNNEAGYKDIMTRLEASKVL